MINECQMVDSFSRTVRLIHLQNAMIVKHYHVTNQYLNATIEYLTNRKRFILLEPGIKRNFTFDFRREDTILGLVGLRSYSEIFKNFRIFKKLSGHRVFYQK